MLNQFGIRLIREFVSSRLRWFAEIKVLIRYSEPTCLFCGEQLPISIDGCIKAFEKEFLRVRCRRVKSHRLQWPDLRHNANHGGEKLRAEAGFSVVVYETLRCSAGHAL